MNFLLDLLKIAFTDTKIIKKFLLSKNKFLDKFKPIINNYHKTLNSLNLEYHLSKLNPFEAQAFNEFIENNQLIQNINQFFNKFKSKKQNILNKLNIKKQTLNYLNDKKNIVPMGSFINMSSSALKGGVFIPTTEVYKQEDNKLVNVRGISRLTFLKGKHDYDYYNISWPIFKKMVQAVGKNGDGAWSVYLELVLHHSKGQTVKLNSSKISKSYKNISNPKDTKSRKFVITTQIPKIKGIKQVKKGS